MPVIVKNCALHGYLNIPVNILDPTTHAGGFPDWDSARAQSHLGPRGTFRPPLWASGEGPGGSRGCPRTARAPACVCLD